MGLRGPAQKPSAIEELEGFPGHRTVNRHEPRPEGEATCPRHLTSEQRKIWRKLAPMLRRMKILTEADSIALAALCSDVCILRDAEAGLARSSLLIKAGDAVRANPLLRVINEASARVLRGLREFGMTPSSRTRLEVPHSPDADSPEGLLDGNWMPRRAAGQPPNLSATEKPN